MYYKDHVKPFEPYYVDILARNICKVDKDEVYASSGYTPKKAILYSILTSNHLICYFSNDNLLGIGGVAPKSNGDGVPWFLRTELFHFWKKNNRRRFFKSSQSWIEHMSEYYPAMSNYVDERNKESITWLKHLGFTFTNKIKYGFLQIPFIKFEKYNG